MIFLKNHPYVPHEVETRHYGPHEISYFVHGICPKSFKLVLFLSQMSRQQSLVFVWRLDNYSYLKIDSQVRIFDQKRLSRPNYSRNDKQREVGWFSKKKRF